MVYDKELSFSGDISKLMVGLEWDPNEEEKGVVSVIKPHNLDLSCAVFDTDMSVVDIITPTHPKRDEYKGQIFHKGDALDGGADFEDEEILVTMDTLDAEIKAISFMVSTNDHVDIASVKNGICRFQDAISLSPFVEIKLSEFISKKDSVSIPRQEHFFAGIIMRAEGDKWVLKDTQFVLPALDGTSLETAVKSIIL